MHGRAALRNLYLAILVVMLVVTLQAAWRQPLWDWGGLVAEPDRWWTIATLADAYCGFLTFYAWVFYKERQAAARVTWFAAIMLLGNLAMAVYVLRQVSRLPSDAPLEHLLLRRATGTRS